MIDCSELFPGYDRAEAFINHDNRHRATVKLWSGGTFATIEVVVDKISPFLDNLRRAQYA